jgi:hypothetical protein
MPCRHAGELKPVKVHVQVLFHAEVSRHGAGAFMTRVRYPPKNPAIQARGPA